MTNESRNLSVAIARSAKRPHEDSLLRAQCLRGARSLGVPAARSRDLYIPMRVLSNASGFELVFTLFRLPGMTDEKFSADAEWVMRDLAAAKRVLEESCRLEASTKAWNHILAEAPHRLHDLRVRHAPIGHLAQHVMRAGIAQRRHLLGDAGRRAVQGRVLERVAHPVLVRQARIVPRTHARGLDLEVGRVVRRARLDHVPPRLQERRRQLVLRLALALCDVDEAPHGGFLAKLLLRRVVEAAFGEPGVVQREPFGDPRDRDACDQDWSADPAALAHRAG